MVLNHRIHRSLMQHGICRPRPVHHFGFASHPRLTLWTMQVLLRQKEEGDDTPKASARRGSDLGFGVFSTLSIRIGDEPRERRGATHYGSV